MVGRFAGTMFLGSALLFCVQPMVAKMIMPMLGGAPAVWITCMVFFQAVLLAGYAYAHATTAWLGARRQAMFHFALVLLPLVVLPIRIGTHGAHASVDPNRPIAFLLSTLLLGVGLPFFVISTTAPLLQKWFSTVRPDDTDPYYLYGASNLGSMLSLAAYPAVIEPRLGLFEQADAWRWGYCVFAAMIAACGVAVVRTKVAAAPGASAPAAREVELPPARILPLRRIRWILLAFVPSSFLLSITTYITTDIAPVPLFWVVPLAVYLATFVLVFAKKPPLSHARMTELFPLLVSVTVLFLVLEARTPMKVIALIHLVTFFVAAMVCHGELAKDRPPPAQLTEFYLWISVGGVLGGIFNGILAPTLFDSIVEYPLILVLACMCLSAPNDEQRGRSRLWITLAAPAGIALTMIIAIRAARAMHLPPDGMTLRLLIGLPIFLCFPFVKQPVRFGLGIGACFVGSALCGGVGGNTIHVERSFFGIVRVTHDESGRFVQIAHGTTIHGAQSTDPALRRTPFTYFTTTGPLGQVFDAFRTKANGAPRDVAIIGLGAGSMAPYRHANESWTYYEIDPLIVSIAENTNYFTYLDDAFPNRQGLKIVIGDARLKLHDAPPKSYDMLVVDAFSSDSIPAHLLTREALAIYREKVKDDGIIVVHISNRYVALETVLGNLAHDAGLVSRIRNDADVSSAELDAGKSPAQWVVLGADEASLGTITSDVRWAPTRTSASHVWTDDFSNLLGVYRW